jgi:HAE1 family hydrophobic/amphiphilic exporter-1
MLLGTLLGVIVVPGLYYAFGKLGEGRALIRDEEDFPLTEDDPVHTEGSEHHA